MRINLYAGPGAGKSTTAARLFSELKELGKSIEQVAEVVKKWAVLKRPVKEYDQVYLLGEQMQSEYLNLSNGMKNIVTDSPVLLSCCYTEFFFPHLEIHESMTTIALAYERDHPSVNIFLNRGNKPYDPQGRYQTADEAKEIDALVRKTLDKTGTVYTEFDFYDKAGILAHVLQKID